MESLNRSIMLLKPMDSRKILRGKNAGTMRLEATQQGLSLSLKTDCLTPDEYSVYLFLHDGSNRFAGTVTDGRLFATLFDLKLQDTAGAAVVHSEGASHSFCLASAGMDWPPVIERFRITHASKPAPPSQDALSPSEAETPVPETTDADALAQDVQPESAADPDFSPPDGAENDFIDEHHIEMDNEPQDEKNCESCPHVTRQIKINPFPSVFPNSAWVKISYPGPSGWWHYISGTIYKDAAIAAKVLGVPGEYGMAPPIWLEGFGTYMRCSSGDAKGYWLMFQDAETGEVLDPA